MPEPVIEQIAEALKERLESITVANGYAFDVTSVIRATKTDETDPAHLTLWITQGDEEPNDGIAYPGNPPAVGWDVPFTLSLVVSDDSYSVDQWRNIGKAAIEKAIKSPNNWHNWEGLAIDTMIEASAPHTEDDGTSIKLTVVVSYRTPENDPYTAA